MKKEIRTLAVLLLLLVFGTYGFTFFNGFHKEEISFLDKKNFQVFAVPFVEAVPGVFSYSSMQGSALLKSGGVEYGVRVSATSTFHLRESIPGTLSAGDKSDTKISYFRGNDRSQWKTNLSAYKTVLYENAWPGINVEFLPRARGLEKVITVGPHSDPGAIEFSINDAFLFEDEDGSLLIQTAEGRARLTAPHAYQVIEGARKDVSVSFSLLDVEMPANQALLLKALNLEAIEKTPPSTSRYGFSVGDYDPSYPLVIDPILEATYYGGSDDELSAFIARQASSGDIYIGGNTFGTDISTITGAFQEAAPGGRDFFIARFSSDLSTLEAATYIGGTSTEQPVVGTLASDGIYMFGVTGSSDFPTTAGAFQETPEISITPFVVFKVSLDLSSLVASTYLSGSTNFKEYGPESIIVSGSDVYVAGYTSATDYPTTTGAYSETAFGGYDTVISRLSSDLTTLEASTYFGGSGDEFRHKLNIAGGSLYVSGDTTSADLETTVGAYQGALSGTQDLFVSKLSLDLTTLEASTYLGGTGSEVAGASSFANSSLFLTGSVPDNFPTTPGAYSETFGGGSNDAGIARLSSDLSTLEAATYLGGSANDITNQFGIGITATRIYVIGQTASTDFPVTPGALMSTFASDSPGYISALSLDLSTLEASTFIGGADAGGNSQVMDIDFDLDDGVYVIGDTSTSDFPVTSGAFDEAYSNGADIFIAHITCDLALSCGGLPTVITGDSSDLGQTSATLSGRIDVLDGENASIRGFVYGNALPYEATTTESGSFAVGSFTSGLTGLRCSSSYHFAAYATTSAGVAYGSDATFVTAPCPSGETPETVLGVVTILGGGGSNGAVVDSGPFAPQTQGVGGSGSSTPSASRFISATSTNTIPVLVLPSPEPEPQVVPVISEPVFRFARDLQYHDRGEDVRSLQQTLNQLGFTLAATGPGSPGNETSIFGIRTYRALARFQLEHNLEPSGYFGSLTKTVLRSLGSH